MGCAPILLHTVIVIRHRCMSSTCNSNIIIGGSKEGVSQCKVDVGLCNINMHECGGGHLEERIR